MIVTRCDYVCGHVCACVCAHTVCVCVRVHVHMRVHARARIHTHTHTQVHELRRQDAAVVSAAFVMDSISLHHRQEMTEYLVHS